MKMWPLTLCVLLLGVISTTAHAQPSQMTPENMAEAREGMAQMKEMMNNPEMKRQMEEARKQMKAHGMDDSLIDQQMQMPLQNMDVAMKLSECMMDGLGADGINRMQASGLNFGNKIEALCKAGKTSEAQAAAIAYGKEIAASKEGKIAKACQEKYADELEKMANAMPTHHGILDKNIDYSKDDACSAYTQ